MSDSSRPQSDVTFHRETASYGSSSDHAHHTLLTHMVAMFHLVIGVRSVGRSSPVFHRITALLAGRLDRDADRGYGTR